MESILLNNPMGGSGAVYYSFLLRMWQVPMNGNPTWRIQIENILTREKHGFTSLEDFLSYLDQVLSQHNQATGEGQ